MAPKVCVRTAGPEEYKRATCVCWGIVQLKRIDARANQAQVSSRNRLQCTSRWRNWRCGARRHTLGIGGGLGVASGGFGRAPSEIVELGECGVGLARPPDLESGAWSAARAAGAVDALGAQRATMRSASGFVNGSSLRIACLRATCPTPPPHTQRNGRAPTPVDNRW